MNCLKTACFAAILFAASFLRAAEPPVFDIPRYDNVTIDGNPVDWGNNGFHIDALTDTAPRLRPASDFQAKVRLAWDPRGILLLAVVSDDVHIEDPRLENLWQKDDVEILLADRPDGNHWDVAISPGVDPKFPELRYKLIDHRVDAELKKTPLTADIRRTKTESGYILEALLPWQNLGIDPVLGKELMLQVRITDVDGRDRNVSRWFPDDPHPPAPTPMHHIRLAEKPSPPADAAAWGTYESFRRTRINLIAPTDAAGKLVEIKDGDRLLASAPLAADTNRSAATITCPMPPNGKPYGPLSVTVAGHLVRTLDLPNPDDARNEELGNAEMITPTPIFTTPGFPACDFEQPAHMEDVLGPYTLTTTWYDAAMNDVKTAEKPGRYGAVVTIRTESGQTFHKYVTLYRVIKRGDFRSVDSFKTLDDLPPDLGIDPAVAKENASIIAADLRRTYSDFPQRPMKPAVVLAALHECKPGEPANTAVSNPLMRDRAWWYGLRKKLGQQKPLPYLAQIPKGYDADPTRKWPLLVNLHGGGGNGDDLKKVRPWFDAFVKKHPELPMIIVFPQSPPRESWLPIALNDMLDELAAKYRVDPDAIYFTGGSMGGNGTWLMGMSYPERLAAIAPLSAMADVADAPRLKELPVWAFHGDVDTASLIDIERKVIDALIAQNARVRYTIYTNGPHDSSSRALMDPRLYEWLLQQRRGKPQQPRANENKEVIETIPYAKQNL